MEPEKDFPVHPTYDEEHFKQMTSEKVVTEYQRGFPIRKWKKVYRNEVPDCRIYATAALMMREVHGRRNPILNQNRNKKLRGNQKNKLLVI
ncbi:MAG: terminase gpA endonuclease subunit [Thermodesulfobacteriota bacterium]